MIIHASPLTHFCYTKQMNDLFVMERDCNEMKEEYDAKFDSLQELIAKLQIELDIEKEMKVSYGPIVELSILFEGLS